MITYKERESFLHGLDMRVKILWLVGITVSLVLFKSLPTATLASITSMLLFQFSGVSLSEIWHDGKNLLFFALIPVPLQVLALPGYEGLMLGLVNAACLANILAAAMLFIYTTKQSKFVGALAWFGVPPSFAFSFALALQFIPIFLREISEVRIAQSARGARLTGPTSVFPMIIPVAHRAFARAEDLAISLDARGFNPEKAVRPNFRMRTPDRAFAAACVALFALIALVG